WLMVTLPVMVQVSLAPKPQTWCAASMSIGWLRSLLRACTPAANEAASMASSNAGQSLARKLTWRRDITGMHIGKECDLLAVEVRFQATAAHCKAGSGDGHGNRGRGAVRAWEQVQLRSLDARGRRHVRWTGGDHVATQA